MLYDGRVLGVRDDGQLQAELVVVPRARADAALARLGALSGWLAGVDLADAEGRPLGVNLLPVAQRHQRRNPWRLWNIVLAALALVALVLGLSQVLDNRGKAAAQLQADVAKRSAQAREVSQQRQRLVDAVEGGAYLQAQRNARPSVIEAMDELARRLPDGTLDPLGLPVWKWEAFYTEIIRSIFDGTWGSSGARAINYWWGMRSGAEEINYQKGLPGGTLHLLDMMEMLLSQEELRIFPDELYDQNHQPHSPASVVYSPKELMEMDWLDECVEGALPHYDDLDVKTRTLMAINGLDNLKGLEK